MEPVDVPVHVRLLAEAGRPGEGVKAFVSPVTNDGAGASCRGASKQKCHHRYTAVVACRYSPFLLGAINNSLRSLGGEEDAVCRSPSEELYFAVLLIAWRVVVHDPYVLASSLLTETMSETLCLFGSKLLPVDIPNTYHMVLRRGSNVHNPYRLDCIDHWRTLALFRRKDT